MPPIGAGTVAHAGSAARKTQTKVLRSKTTTASRTSSCAGREFARSRSARGGAAPYAPRYAANNVDTRPHQRLTLRLAGRAVDQGRLPLSELVRVSSRLQTALKHVATVIATSRPSGGFGRLPKAIEEVTDLRIIAPPRPGSFVLELQLPDPPPELPEVLPGMEVERTLGERALGALVAGLQQVSDETQRLPEGFDYGVLRTVSQVDTAFKRGVDSVELSLNGAAPQPLLARLDRSRVQAAKKLVRRPLVGQLTVEGLLRMVDLDTLEFRVDRPGFPGVSCFFPEKLRDGVVSALDQPVRVTGEAEFLPNDQPKRLDVRDFAPLHEVMGVDAQLFWEHMTLDDLLAKTQPRASVGRERPGTQDDIGATEVWPDDAEFEQFLRSIRRTGGMEEPQ